MEIDGVPLLDYIDKNLVPYRNLGDKTANYTMHMNNLFTRMNLGMPMPQKQDVVLTVMRDEKKVKITVPWIVRDLYDFKADQAIRKAMDNNEKRLTVKDPVSGANYSISFLDERGKPMNAGQALRMYREGAKSPLDTFLVQSLSSISIEAAPKLGEEEAPAVGIEKLKKERKVPDGAIAISEAKTYPAYMYTADVNDASGKKRGTKRIGVIRIDTFSPDADEDTVIEELKKTLTLFEKNGVNSLILDTIENPGGSLRLLLKVSQLFSSKKIDVPTMKVVLNDTWMNEFLEVSLDRNTPDPIREKARRVHEQLVREKAEGKRISSPVSMEAIMPFQLDMMKGFDFERVVMLTNEMNASCGDIFPAILQDNKIAVIAGTKTMGAGGNVTQHQWDQSPNMHISVSQTESLVVRTNGKLIEDLGVSPDLEIDTNAAKEGKYASVYKKVEKEVLLAKKDPLKDLQAKRAGKEAFEALSVGCSKLFSQAK